MAESEGPLRGDLRIGEPERDIARETLQEHVDAGRIDAAEVDLRTRRVPA